MFGRAKLLAKIAELHDLHRGMMIDKARVEGELAGARGQNEQLARLLDKSLDQNATVVAELGKLRREGFNPVVPGTPERNWSAIADDTPQEILTAARDRAAVGTSLYFELIRQGKDDLNSGATPVEAAQSILRGSVLNPLTD